MAGAGSVEYIHVDALGLGLTDVRGGLLLGEELSEGACDSLGSFRIDIVGVDLDEALVDHRLGADQPEHPLRSEVQPLGLVDLAGQVGRLDPLGHRPQHPFNRLLLAEVGPARASPAGGRSSGRQGSGRARRGTRLRGREHDQRDDPPALAEHQQVVAVRHDVQAPAHSRRRRNATGGDLADRRQAELPLQLTTIVDAAVETVEQECQRETQRQPEQARAAQARRPVNRSTLPARRWGYSRC